MQANAGFVLPDWRNGDPRDHGSYVGGNKEQNNGDKRSGIDATIYEDRYLPRVLQGVCDVEVDSPNYLRFRVLFLR